MCSRYYVDPDMIEEIIKVVQKIDQKIHPTRKDIRPTDVGRILRTFKIKKNVEVTDNGKIII